MAEMIYPSLTTNRFQHALGTMHLARFAWRSAWANSQSFSGASGSSVTADFMEAYRSDAAVTQPAGEVFEQWIEDIVGFVALLHNIGYPPFSHALTDFFDEARQTRQWYADPESGATPHMLAPQPTLQASYGEQLFSEVCSWLQTQPSVANYNIEAFTAACQAVYEAKADSHSWARTLRSIVSYEIDVDRIDYIMRDALFAGTEYGALDYTRLLGNLELHWSKSQNDFRVGPGSRARSAAEKIAIERTQAYRWIYFHAGVVASDLALLRACQSLRSLEMLDMFGQEYLTLRPNLQFVPPHRAKSADTQTVRWNQQVFNYASVDDSVVVEWLRKGLALTDRLVEANAISTTDVRVWTFWSTAQIVLKRAKLWTTLWKSHEDFVKQANSLLSDMRQAVLDALNSLTASSATSDHGHWMSFATWLKALRTIGLGEPVVALNHFLLKYSGTNGELLREHLQLAYPSPPGSEFRMWDVAVRHFNWVGHLPIVFHAEQEVCLADSSPLVAAIHDATLVLPQVMVFRLGPRSSSSEGDRIACQNMFKQCFPTFLRDSIRAEARLLWPTALEGTVA